MNWEVRHFEASSGSSHRGGQAGHRDFQHRACSGPTPGATASLTLNSDGTISATGPRYPLQLVGFGVDSIFQYPSFDFSSPDATSSGWGTSRRFCDRLDEHDRRDSMTWLIGSPGTFASIAGVLDGPGSAYDAFIFARDPLSGAFTQYAADFTSVPAVPEPETYALLLAGLGAVAMLTRRDLRLGDSAGDSTLAEACWDWTGRGSGSKLPP